MSLTDFLSRLTTVFEATRIDYMVVGSLASTVHGLARTTQDIDVVVELDVSRLAELLEHCPEEDYYLSESAARDAIRLHSQFNIIDMQTGWKADLIIRKPRVFSREEFSRRQRATLAGVDVYIATAEDTIVAKLEWASRGQSERQLRDVAGILSISGPQLDMDRVESWVQTLGLTEVWNSALAQSSA